VPDAPKLNPAQSGRLELAQWLTSDQNPLTARVFVNRVWRALYGEGIVKTVDNFGLTGDRPSHPELLDHLAAGFMNDGWSLKRLVRRIVVSRSYQLSSEASPAHLEADPGNRLVWRHSPRRLDAEEVRDTILAASGRLRLEPPKGSPADALKMIEIRDNGIESRNVHEKADQSVVRSVYLPLLRGLTPHALEAFDPVTQSLVTGQRDATTTPTQALFVMNSGFVRRQSLALAERVLSEPQADSARIRQAYRLALSRDPSPIEMDRAQSFLAAFQYRAPAPTAAPVEAKVPLSSPIPADPDNVDRTDFIAAEVTVNPTNAKSAAWQSLAQALFASAEFRFIR
jgi:hypothetical protein